MSGNGVEFTSVKTTLQITVQLRAKQTPAFKMSRTGSIEKMLTKAYPGSRGVNGWGGSVRGRQHLPRIVGNSGGRSREVLGLFEVVNQFWGNRESRFFPATR
jgi:hypothetical protein